MCGGGDEVRRIIRIQILSHKKKHEGTRSHSANHELQSRPELDVVSAGAKQVAGAAAVTLRGDTAETFRQRAQTRAGKNERRGQRAAIRDVRGTEPWLCWPVLRLFGNVQGEQ